VQIGDVIQGLGQTIDMQRYWALIQTTGNHLLFDAPEVRSLMECMPGEKMPLFKKLIIWMAASELELQLTFYIQERFEALTAAEGALFDEQGEEGAATVHVSCRVFGRAPTLTTTNPRNGVSKIRAAYRLLMLCLDRHYPVAQREIFRSSLLSYLDEDLDLTRSFGDGVVELERCDIRALTGCGTELPEVVSEYADNVPEALQDTLGIREAAIASAAAAK
jgi:hypothetical protein